MIVDLGNGVALNPGQVVSVRRSYHETHLIITDVLGQVHEVPRSYGESIYDVEKRVIAMLSSSPSNQETAR